MIRQACGTRMGSLLHIEHTEQLCGTCEAGEKYRSLVAESKRHQPELPRPDGGFNLQPLIAALDAVWHTPKDARRTDEIDRGER